MSFQSSIPIGAFESSQMAMKWLQSLTDAYRAGVLVPSPYLLEEELEELDREIRQFVCRQLPRLHDSFRTDPAHKATVHLHCFRIEGEPQDCEATP